MENTRWTDFWVVNVFTDTLFQGNPAGVVFADHVSAEQMRLIAREIAASETTFVLPAEKAGADLQLRWFTDTCELPFSGHATLAALHILQETKRYRPPATLTLDTLSGPLKGWLCQQAKRVYPMVEVPRPHFEACPIQLGDLVEAMLISKRALDPTLPIQKQGLNLLVPLRDRDRLQNLYPDFRRLSRLGLEHDVTGFVCLSTETSDPTVDWSLRLFAPGVGINEDPVSGAAHAVTAVYLLEQDRLTVSPGQTLASWTGEQGEISERYGRIQVECTIDEKGWASQVRIGGLSITVIQGQLRIA